MQQATSPKRQRGQVLIVVIALSAVLAAGLFSLYNVGQLTTNKQQLNDAADAAAYSGAVVLAQGYNYTAYTNRAILANNAMIGQMVSLRSTLAMSQWYWKNSSTAWGAVGALGRFIPWVGPAVYAVANAVSKFSDVWGDRVIYAARKVAEYLSLTGTAAIGLTNQVMWGAQQIQLAESVGTFEFIVNRVANENAPNARIDPVMFATAFGPVATAGMLWNHLEPKVRKGHRTIGTPEAKNDKYLQLIAETNDGIHPAIYTNSRNLIPNAVGLWMAAGCDQPGFTGSVTGMFEANAGMGEPINTIGSVLQVVTSLLSPVGNMFMCLFDRQGGSELVQLKDGHFSWTAVDAMSLKIPVVRNFVGDLPFAGGSVTSFVDEDQVGNKYPESLRYMIDRIKRNELANKDNRVKYFGNNSATQADCVEFVKPGTRDLYTVSTTTRNDGTCATLGTGTDASAQDKGLWSGGLANTAERTLNSSPARVVSGFGLPINADVLSSTVGRMVDGVSVPRNTGTDTSQMGNAMPAGLGADGNSATVTGLPNTEALLQAGGDMASGLANTAAGVGGSMGSLTQILTPGNLVSGVSPTQVMKEALLGDTSGRGRDGSGPGWFFRRFLRAMGFGPVIDLMTLKVSDGVESPRNRSVNKALRTLGDGLPKWFWDIKVKPTTVGNPEEGWEYTMTITDGDMQDFNHRRYGLGPLVYAPLIMDTNRIKTSQKIPAGGERMGLPDYTGGARPGMRAIGKARVFYRQPNDHWLSRYKTQTLPNLLLPYWQARNEGLSYADKWGLLAIDGLTGAYLEAATPATP